MPVIPVFAAVHVLPLFTERNTPLPVPANSPLSDEAKLATSMYPGNVVCSHCARALGMVKANAIMKTNDVKTRRFITASFIVVGKKTLQVTEEFRITKQEKRCAFPLAPRAGRGQGE